MSVSHTLATVEEVESAAPADPSAAAQRLAARPGVDESVVLATCNRAEAYVVTDDDADGRDALADFAPEVREGAVTQYDHEGAIRHLMRVASGLESLVLGEDQIIGQVKDVMERAREDGTLGPVLEEALLKAVHVGERARTETAINEGTVSMGSAAVELAAREAELEDATALVLGAGEMGTLAARAFDGAGVDRLVVANRTVTNAEHVAQDVGVDADAVGLAAAPAAAQDATVVVAATGAPDPVLDAGDLDGADAVCVDIARPRDIDPAADELDGVVVHDIDDLERVTERAHEQRRTAARQVEAMIEEEHDRLLSSLKRARADEAIRGMYEGAERMKGRELDRALTKLEAQGDLNEDQRETVEALADSLVSQLLAPPTESLREAAGEDDWNTIRTAMELFDPTVDVVDAEGAADAADEAAGE
ncbi:MULTISPECIES: glutamyl-tRNA reductase [Halolamina]|uniref:Glutamyl-tRNA reductase n=1 Tax=Halolamina pelagica TaxID=699431 RepID=A0A1I5SIR1_9EURY|nr:MULTISPECIES: glutamyl-tRNA reductase [Halolamina]SFP70598.1 glutamyl-tRNA reductase [Halolamina pelagica]